VLETAGTHERFVQRGKIVAIRIKTCANAIKVAERGKELERSGKKASAVEEIEQPPWPGRGSGHRIPTARRLRRHQSEARRMPRE
jgi:hypothetical protein